MLRKEIKYKSKTKIKSLPLFPRYIFIQANEIASKKIHLIRSTVGVSSLILRDGKPIYVKDEILDAIRHAVRFSEIQKKKNYDYIFDLDVTSPLRNYSDIQNTFVKFKK